MSHELRTPLNGILGITDILLRAGPDAKSEGLLRHQAEAGQQLLGIISNVLDWTKIEEGRLDLRKAPVAVHQIVEACIGMLGPAAANKGIAIESDVSPDLPHSVVVDALRVQQVVLNFLSNAIRHSERGLVRLTARVSAKGGLRLAVTDSGPGIPRGREHLLFQKFSQISQTGGGSGLGLAIAKRLAEAMGGSVGFASEIGQGATFWLDLPLDVKALAPPAAPRAEAPVPSNSPPARILVAEDTALNRMVIEAMLREGGHDVVMVEDGSRAVDMARAGEFDIVFMDVQMPVMNGIDATRAIRSIPGARGSVPIVALTANSFADEIDRCLRSGMDAHLAKPVDAAALFKEIRLRVRPPEPVRSCA
jgi:CheY-like chemotaxis protein